MNLKFQKAEQAYCPNVEPEFDNNDIEDFLIENFKIPDNNLNQISSLINEYGELKKLNYLELWSSRILTSRAVDASASRITVLSPQSLRFTKFS